MQQQRKYNFLMRTLVTIFILALSVSACSHDSNDNKKKTLRTITVQPKVQTTSLYYDGKINPINTVNISSPADGTITQLFFNYGESIKKGAKLLEMRTTKLETTYQQDLTSFLKAKEKLATSQQQYKVNLEMEKLQIIARNKLEESRSTLADDNLALLQARFKLQKDITTLGLDDKITDLQLQNIDQVRKAMFGRQYNHILVHAPTTGVILFSDATGSSAAGGSGKPLEVGSHVKQGQTLVAIGNLTGLSVKIPVSEVDIDQLKKGQKATITGVAFPSITLHGSVTNIDKQAQTSQAGQSGLATFPVTIAIPNISAAARQKIHVGMSAKVSLIIAHPPMIMVPLTAVSQVNGHASVKVYNSKTKKITVVPVETGQTTQNSVAIVSGLKSGDQVVVNE